MTTPSAEAQRSPGLSPDQAAAPSTSVAGSAATARRDWLTTQPPAPPPTRRMRAPLEHSTGEAHTHHSQAPRLKQLSPAYPCPLIPSSPLAQWRAANANEETRPTPTPGSQPGKLSDEYAQRARFNRAPRVSRRLRRSGAGCGRVTDFTRKTWMVLWEGEKSQFSPTRELPLCRNVCAWARGGGVSGDLSVAVRTTSRGRGGDPSRILRPALMPAAGGAP